MIVTDVFVDRAIFTAIGAVIGLLVGLLISAIREAREAKSECHELRHLVEQWMEHESHKEHGRASFQTIAIAIAVLLTAYAAFASQLAINKSDQNSTCTESTVFKALISLDQRTQFTEDQAQANIKLQRAQADYLDIASDTKATDRQRRAAFFGYFDALIEYNKIAAQTVAKVRSYPFPSPEDYRDCLHGD